MSEFENNGFHNENLENSQINNNVAGNRENYEQSDIAIDVTPIEETTSREQSESHRYSYKEQGLGGRYDQADTGYNHTYGSNNYGDNNYYSNIPPEPDKRRRQRKNGNNKNGNGIGKKIAKLVASAAVFGLVA